MYSSYSTYIKAENVTLFYNALTKNMQGNRIRGWVHRIQ